MKLTRRFLALLLALSMSLSMVTPAYASEAETIDETEPVVVVEETEAAAVETTEAETEAAPVVTTEAVTEAPETEAPVVVETEAPVVEETEAVVETEAPVVEETEPVVIETEPVTAAVDAANEAEAEIVTILDENAETENVVEFTMTVPAGSSVTYQGRVSGMILTIYADDVTVENNGNTFVSEWGYLEAAISGGDFFNPPTIVVTNNAAEDATYEATFAYPMGDMMNPQYMYGVGAYEAELAADDNDGHYYTFEPDFDATLYVKINKITEGAVGDVVITNDVTYVQKSISADGVDGVLELTVAAGDIYSIQAMVVPNEDYSIPAAKIEWEINYPVGTVDNPDQLTWNEEHTVGTGTFEVPADVEAYYVSLGRATGMMLSINGEEPVEQVAEDPMMPIVITLAGGQTYELLLNYPVGNAGNPDTLWSLGTYTTSLEEGDQDGYTYTLTADAAGTVYVSIDSITEGVVGNILITKGYAQYSLIDEAVDGLLAIELAAGDELTIRVMAEPDTSDMFNWVYPAADIEWTINYPAGTAENPIMPEWNWNEASTEADFVITVPAGASYLVRDYSIAGMELSINNGAPQLMVGQPRQPIEFTLDNTAGTEAVEYALHVAWPAGTYSNPEELYLGSNWTSLEEGDQDGYYYSYIVESDGTLYASIDSITEGVVGNIIINNNTSYANMNLVYDGVDGVVAMDVAAGDELVVQVMAEPDTTDMFNWVYPAADITWSINYEQGHKLNPIVTLIEGNGHAVPVAVPAGESVSYQVSGAAGMILTMKANSKTTVTVGYMDPMTWETVEQTFKANSKGVVSFTVPGGGGMGRPMPTDITVTNGHKTNAVSSEMVFAFPAGHMSNPAALKLGNSTLKLAANNSGYFYNYTAEECGYFTFAMTSKANWNYCVNVLGEDGWPVVYGDNHSYLDQPVVASEQIWVEAGQTVQITVGTADANYGAPAGTLKFTTAFVPAEYTVASGKSLTLKFMDPATGKAVSAKKVAWQIVDAYVDNPYSDEEVHFNDVSAYATLKNGKLSTKKCGDSVYLLVQGSYNGVTNTYYIEILPATNILAIWQTWYDYDEYGNEILCHDVVQGNWTWNANGATEEDVPDMGWDLDAFSYPGNSSQKVNWKSSNKKIATIDENGVVGFVWNAKKGTVNTGTVTITATAADGSGKKASFKLTVTADKFPEYFELVRVDGKAFEQGEYLYDEEVYNPETGDYEYVPVYEKVMYIAPGETIKLKANIDPTAGKKYQTSDWWWYGDVMFTMKKLSGNQYSVKANKDAHDGAWCYVDAQVPYCGSEEIKVVVKSPVTKKLEICWLGEDYYEPITWSPSFDINEFDFESEDGWNSIMMKAVLIGSDGSAEVVDADWITSNKKVAAPEEFSWDELGAQYNLTGKLGSFKATASYKDADGKTYQDSVTFEIADMSKWVNSLEITAPEQFMGTIMDYVEVWNEEYGYWEWVEAEVPAIYISAGQSVKLTAKVNASAKNKKFAWNCYVQEYNEYFYENVKISKSGKLTIGKNIPESIMFYVECWPTSNNRVGSVRIPVIVMPRATNVHARMITEDGTPFYVSNTTQTVGAWEGNRIEIDALVYPFEASQDVTWKSNKTKIVKIVTEIDDEGVEHTYMEFTGKTGKVTITATADDGSKEKATFTLNVITPVVE